MRVNIGHMSCARRVERAPEGSARASGIQDEMSYVEKCDLKLLQGSACNNEPDGEQGLIKNHMLVCFNPLTTDTARKDAKAKSMNALLRNGLAMNGRFIRWPNDGKFSGTTNRSMTSPFSIMFARLQFSHRYDNVQ